MSFRPEAFRLDPFSKVRFWRGCFWFFVKGIQPPAEAVSGRRAFWPFNELENGLVVRKQPC